MSTMKASRVKTALGVLAIAAAGAAWTGCGDDDLDQATNDIKEAGEDIKDEAQEAGEEIKDEAEELDDEIGGDDETTSTSSTDSDY
jgi:gas vesicle protein